MQIDWLSFTPIPSLLGGMMLGLAATLYVLLHGRILGISGIVSGLVHPKKEDWSWRLAFIVGLITAPFLAALFFGILPVIKVDASWLTVIIAGLLVGFGVQYGSGCTSGHGICGLSRLSPRSLVATLSFMTAGFLVVFIIRHLI
jgi:uncharacterized membrane protein YedE/YeeE